MPANPKYLSSPFERFLKISAGILGGYLLTVSAFGAIASFGAKAEVLFTLQYAGFLLWAGLLVCAFLVRNGWKIWLLYLALTALCLSVVFINNG